MARRVLVSPEWSGKTLAEHRADRAAVVREALLSAGLVAPEIERLAASVRAADGLPRYVWTDERPDPASYVRTILAAITERQRWRAQIPTGCGHRFGNWPTRDHPFPLPSPDIFDSGPE